MQMDTRCVDARITVCCQYNTHTWWHIALRGGGGTRRKQLRGVLCNSRPRQTSQLQPSPSPPRTSPPLPLRHGEHATAAVPCRWLSATAAATSTAGITATAAATSFAATLAEMCLSTKASAQKRR